MIRWRDRFHGQPLTDNPSGMATLLSARKKLGFVIATTAGSWLFLALLVASFVITFFG